METQVFVETQSNIAERPAAARPIERDLDSYLDAIADATAVFREAVDTYVHSGADGGCWRQARRIDEHLRTLDELQQKLETRAHAQSIFDALFADMADPLAGVGRMLRDMKRQITRFAIESGFSGPGRRVPPSLVPDIEALTEDVCAAVEALVGAYRPCTLWWDQSALASGQDRVGWYEGRADQQSTALIRKIFHDEGLDIRESLALAQLVEEIDRVADFALGIERELRARRELGDRQSPVVRESH